MTKDVTVAKGDTLIVADAAKITTAKKITLEGTLGQASAKNVTLKKGATVAVKAETAAFTNANSGVFTLDDAGETITVSDTTNSQSVTITDAATPTYYTGSAKDLDGTAHGTDNGQNITLSIASGKVQLLCADD